MLCISEKKNFSADALIFVSGFFLGIYPDLGDFPLCLRTKALYTLEI